MSSVRRLARCIYSDRLVCSCGELVPIRIMAPVGPRERPADVYTTSFPCKACKAVWGVQLQTRGYPHLRVQRLDK